MTSIIRLAVAVALAYVAASAALLVAVEIRGGLD